MTNGRYWPTLAGNALDYMEVPVVPEMAPHHHHEAVDAESHLRAARCPRYMIARSVPKQPQCEINNDLQAKKTTGHY